VSIYKLSPESLAIIDEIVAAAPEFTPAQLSMITAITGLVPVDPPSSPSPTANRASVDPSAAH
jgi:hypothetical protein